MIDKYLESLEGFMLRKIKWVTEKFIEERKIPTINQFKRRAILNNKTSDESERIQRAIEETLIQIEAVVNHS